MTTFHPRPVDPFSSYGAWLASAHSDGCTGDPTQDYDLYVESFWTQHKAAYEAEKEALQLDDDVTWAVYAETVLDERLDEDEFYHQFLDAQEERAREAHFENLYPDARM